MRQVPAHTSYLIVGGGRVARHISYYFELEKISCSKWARGEDLGVLQMLAESASHVLVLISDSAIEEFLSKAPFLKNKICVHMSGALNTDLAYGAHPLMTFANELYSHQDYARIPFICEKGGPAFSELLPGLTNPHFEIAREMKPLYHALCVMSGNFTTLLWQKTIADFHDKLSLPREALLPYLEQTITNLARAKESVLTGPLSRGDHSTIAQNLQALAGDPYREVYLSFVTAFTAEQKRQQELQHEIHS